MRPVAEFVRFDIRNNRPLPRQAVTGVAECPRCLCVGTIVDMGACCAVAAWRDAGGAWDVPTPWAVLMKAYK